MLLSSNYYIDAKTLNLKINSWYTFDLRIYLELQKHFMAIEI